VSLEKIDRYIKELTAIKEYDNVCQQLNDARLTIADLRSDLKQLSELLAQTQQERDNFKSIVTQLPSFSTDLDYLNNKHSENQR
jgi:ABC-type transporter Mla subunit MlaD